MRDVDLAGPGGADSGALVGRRDEVAKVLERLRTPGLRLVTICGVSGVGKSALALAVVEELATEDPVGVTTVRLDVGPGTGTEPVEAALAPVDGGGPAGEVNATPPPGRTRLVLLDGLEAVPGAAPVVAAALEADPDLTVLATSVVPLSLRDEHVVRLEPLAVPASGTLRRDDLLASPAVRLVVDRIQAATHGPPFDDRQLGRLADLCRALDGVPLALELAAYRCSSLGIDTVLDQIERRSPLEVLTSGPVDTAAHHRSLRATLQWTYDLVDEDGRRLLRRLGVFVDSFTWDSMEAVAVDPGEPTDGLADQLSTLLDAGLARTAPSAGTLAAPRFALSPAVSRFAQDQLAEEGLLDEVLDRHTEHFRALARRVAPRFWSTERHPEVRRLRPEVPEFVAAIQRLGGRGDTEGMLRLVVDLFPLWGERSASGRGAHLLAGALGDEQALPPELRCMVWACAVDMRVWGQPVRGLEFDLVDRVDEMLELSEDDPGLRLIVLEAAVQEMVLARDGDRTIALADAGAALSSETGDDWWLARFLIWQSVAANFFGRTEDAIEFAARSRDLAGAIGDEWQHVRSTHVLANTPGARESGIPLPDIRDLVEQAERIEDPQTDGMARLGAAYAALGSGDLPGVAEHLRRALDLGRRDGMWFLEELSVFVLVVAAAATGRLVTAARLHGALRSALGDPTKVLPPDYVLVYDTVVDGVLEALGDEAFQTELTGGHLLGWREALRLADETVRELGGIADDTEEATSLSPREQEILALIAQGSSNKEIATTLGLRPKTVMHHSSHIYRKLGVRSRAEAVTAAFRAGLLDDPTD